MSLKSIGPTKLDSFFPAFIEGKNSLCIGVRTFVTRMDSKNLGRC